MADAVAGGLHLAEVDAEVARAGADGGRGQALCPTSSVLSEVEGRSSDRRCLARFDFGLRPPLGANGCWFCSSTLVTGSSLAISGVACTAPSPSGRSSLLSSTGSAARSAPAVSITASTEPIATWSPTSPASSTTLPATGRFHLDRRLVGHHVGERLVLVDLVADLDVPGDDLGLGDAFADVGQLEFVASHRSASITFSSAALDALRAGEIGPFVGVRVGRVPAGHALDRRLEVIEAALLDQRDELGAEAARSAAPRARSRSGRSSSTDCSIVSMSSGTSVRRSMTSASTPGSSTAASATWTIVP